MTDKIMPINEVLYQIQTTLKAPKNQYNSYGKYNYRSCEDILEAVKKELPYGVNLQITDEMVQLGDRYYVKATAVLTSGTESLAVSASAREPLNRKGMDESQITGATSSYARKYALNGLFCIDDTKDPDATNDHGDKVQQVKDAFVGSKEQPQEKPQYKTTLIPTGHDVPKGYWDNFKTDKELAYQILRDTSGLSGKIGVMKNEFGKWCIGTEEEDIPQ